MPYWLFKQEPDCYGYDDLARDGQTQWDGIANAQALIHLRKCAPGDKVFYYHTGKEKAIVGIMEVVGPPVPNPELNDPKFVMVPVKAVKKLANPVTLAAIKADGAFADWELVKQSRLSVMPVSAALWKRIERMAKGK